KVRTSIIPGDHSATTVGWTDGKLATPCKVWDRGVQPVVPSSVRCYYADRWMFEYSGDTLIRVQEYAEPYPERHIAIVLQNLVIEEIELRELRPEDLPEDMRNPERTVEALKPSNPTWLWMDSSGARPPIPAPLADPFGFRWRFDQGSSKDFRLVNGNWFHVPGRPGFLAGMQMPDTAVILPAEVPQRPVVLSMKIRFARPAQANAMTVSAGWTKDN